MGGWWGIGESISLPGIAFLTGNHQIVQCVRTAVRSRYDMIDSREERWDSCVCLPSTVVTVRSVPLEDVISNILLPSFTQKQLSHFP